MESKSVLVSYGDRKKVLKIKVDSQLTDLEFVTKEFKKEFSFDSNVNIVLTFQRFDSEWGEYIDLEPEATLNHKDKLTAVVTPTLVTPTVTPTLSADTKVSVSYNYVATCMWVNTEEQR